MRATHRVKNNYDKTVGFILDDGNFYNEFHLEMIINDVDNIKLLSNGVLRGDKKLPIINYSSLNKIKYDILLEDNPFIRDIQEELIDWKLNPLHKVIQIDGARQIGKTTELQKFAYKNYDYVIYINISNDTFNFVDTVINNGCFPAYMHVYCKKANLPNYIDSKKTLLIIDEIQNNSNVYNSIRTLHGNLKCDLIITGSYLGRVLNKGFFLAAGTVEVIKMYPLSFREFCRVFNKHIILDDISLFGEDSDESYNALYKLYDIYRKIGGYPEVVKTYINSRNVGECMDVINRILTIFEQESSVYFTDSKEYLIFRAVYEEAVRFMCSEKKGNNTVILEDMTINIKNSGKTIISKAEVIGALNWLILSNIIDTSTLNVNGDTKNLRYDRRLYFLDCGILNGVINNISDINNDNIEGLITENFAYIELYRLFKNKTTKKKVKGRLPSFSTYNNYELDFVIADEDRKIYGIEVKTKEGNAKSLKVFLNKGLIDKGILAQRTKGGKGDNFNTIPIFAVGARFPYN